MNKVLILVRAWRYASGEMFGGKFGGTPYYYAEFSDGGLYRVNVNGGKRGACAWTLKDWLAEVVRAESYAEFTPCAFEVGKVYQTRGGGLRIVTEIEGDRMDVANPDSGEVTGGRFLDGRMFEDRTTGLDLMLGAAPEVTETREEYLVSLLDWERGLSTDLATDLVREAVITQDLRQQLEVTLAQVYRLEAKLDTVDRLEGRVRLLEGRLLAIHDISDADA